MKIVSKVTETESDSQGKLVICPFGGIHLLQTRGRHVCQFVLASFLHILQA